MKTKKPVRSRRAIEKNFPFVEISRIAERESWRKEIYRPIYYLHKWWARRLGSVFRAIIIGACAREDQNILDLFYKPTRFPNSIVYDPMMGSGVTVGEAIKLGCKVIGRDINPVSYLLVKSFLNEYSVSEVVMTFEDIKKDVSEKIKSYYKSLTQDNKTIDVLYYFWVKTVTCPYCGQEVDLFKSRIFSRHAYPRKNPTAKSICPHCGAVNTVLVSDTKVKCDDCNAMYNPQIGSAQRSKATCSECSKTFSIIDAIRVHEHPPKHRMYAKMVLRANGKKDYRPIDEYDNKLYEKASRDLKNSNIRIPKIEIQPGYNTNQILNYNYKFWHSLFNDRQLLCLAILRNKIRKIQNETIKELFTCLFSGCLEFNNMFCSFKGEGTGAVRHMFSHHILKPEKMPLEANLWGTPKSSGSFSTLFKSRVMRALKYKENPFELRLIPGTKSASKVFNISHKIFGKIAPSYSKFIEKNRDVYFSCGSSDKTDIEKGEIDVIVTDPPFFANVQYSQLADFFYVWQREILSHRRIFKDKTTRSKKEIQQIDANRFANNLTAVFDDCNRILKDGGLMVFTFHQSHFQGWTAILKSLHKSNFCVEAVYPVQSEMSVAVPKNQAKSPINLDVIIVCRKINQTKMLRQIPLDLLDQCVEKSKEATRKFNLIGKYLSQNDIKVILMANLVRALSKNYKLETSTKFLTLREKEIERVAEEMKKDQFEI